MSATAVNEFLGSPIPVNMNGYLPDVNGVCKSIPTTRILVPRRRYFTFNGSSTDTVNGEVSAGSDIVEGSAHVCFSQDGSWFEGCLTTADQTGHYALRGNRQDRSPSEADPVATLMTNGHHATNNHRDSPRGSPDREVCSGGGLYDVTVVDHDDEQGYHFRSVRLNRSDSSWSLSSPHLTFDAQTTHRGQKADLLIQKYLTPRLVGNNLKVSVGRLTMDLTAALNSLNTEGQLNSAAPRRTNSDPSRLWCL